MTILVLMRTHSPTSWPKRYWPWICEVEQRNMLGLLRALRDQYCSTVPNSRQPAKRMDPPSNSELFRWLTEGAVELNGERVGPKATIPERVESLVFFPRGKQRITVV